jgi:NIMA (never in mitosis gene a)-related kinase
MNNYNIIQEIGTGAHSKVYKVQKNGQLYAMKKISLKNISNNQKKYLLSELKILSEHNCQYIIKYYDSFVFDDSINYIMEYCAKGTLYGAIKNKQMPDDLIWKYFSQLCYSIDYLHKNKIIHRDLKSTNILIDGNDNIKLIDFGVSKILNDYMTYTKSFVGTPYSMSPEILRNVFYDCKVDVWALGIILYELTHKKMPFNCKTIEQLNQQILQGKYILNDSINSNFKGIIKRCLQTSPHKRIRLPEILKLSTVKKHKPITECFQKIKQIDKIPNFTIEWKGIVNNIPKQLPPTQDKKEQKKIIYNRDFMDNYSKDNLIHLNNKLIDMLIEKDAIIKKLSEQLKNNN